MAVVGVAEAEEAPRPKAASCASSQQRSAPLRAGQAAGRRRAVLEDAPGLVPSAAAAVETSVQRDVIVVEDDDDDDEGARARQGGRKKQPQQRQRQRQPSSAMSRITQAASGRRGRPVRAAVSNPYVSREAHCDEDLVDGSGADEDEDEDEETDLSGFIVDDDAEISFYDTEQDALSSSSGESESERDARSRRGVRRLRVQKTVMSTTTTTMTTRRRLVRGRKNQVSDSEESNDDDQGLSKALDGMNLGGKRLEQEKDATRRKTIEVIDLTSSPIADPPPVADRRDDEDEQPIKAVPSLIDPFTTLNTALQLQPPTKDVSRILPSKLGPLTADPSQRPKLVSGSEQPRTPPATPPRSPSKLRSPTKLKSPTKNSSPAKEHKVHRQSTDAFWDHNAVNEWADTYSPKKAPLLSPRKNPLARFNLYADDDDIEHLSDEEASANGSQGLGNEEPLDSLPSPCNSPTKPRSPSKSAGLKNELSRLRDEKKARLTAKKKFDAEKERMAIDLLRALDANVTSSKISSLSRSTGGIKLIWSKTLRSTAGRANWKRTVSKPSGSPVKGKLDSTTIERQPGIVVEHFASIELAEKIIDRPERLVSTLAHEFCHLANFMVSGVRDQPHGSSFQQWGRKVTGWLKSPAARRAAGWRPEWMSTEVTTKHSYVVETKYLWVCTGRPTGKMGLTARMLGLDREEEDEGGCGAEYGRHSKSIDVDKQRCGVCKGFLVQVRPTPRAAAVASPKKSTVKGGRLGTLKEECGSDVRRLEKLLEGVDLSD